MIEKKHPVARFTPYLMFLACFFLLCHVYRAPEITPISVSYSDIKPVFTVPNLADSTHIEQRKIDFFTFLSPVIDSENRRIEKIRGSLLSLFSRINAGESLSEKALFWLTVTADDFGLKQIDPHDPVMQEKLLRRVDTIPVSLALAQSVLESAWGTSRFARQGNNLFGQWTYTRGSGMIPLNRDQGRTHEVARFISVNESVRAYMNNLNTHKSYKKLRDLRQALRQKGEEPTGIALAEGLLYYSEKGRTYVKRVQSLIRSNETYMTQ